MLIRNYLEGPAVQTEIHGGKGICEYRPVYETEDFSAPLRFLNYTVIPPEGTFGLHAHGDDNEVYVILEGTGFYTENGETRAVKTGDIIINDRFAVHGIENTGSVPMKVIVFEAFNRTEERPSAQK